MCSAFKFKNCFGRNFDYEESYNEELIIIPPTENRYPTNKKIIGIGIIADDYPLLYDGMNSEGLCVAGLSFPSNAKYSNEDDDNIISNIPSYDVTLFILSNCKTVNQCKGLFESANITNYSFEDINPSPLHWIVSDNKETIVIEQTKEGLNVYDNPLEVLTNNPPFPQMFNVISENMEQIGKYQVNYDTRGKETFLLSGGYTSMERFQRLAYLKQQAEKQDKFDEVETTFHLLQSVEQIYGATPVKDKYEYTIYSAVYDTKNLELYIRKYDDIIYKEILPTQIYDVNYLYREKI